MALSFHWRRVDAGFESPLLLLVADFQPVLDQPDAVVDDLLLESGANLQETLVLLLGAETHHVFHAGAVVPVPSKNYIRA
jgi:hypothetical protein